MPSPDDFEQSLKNYDPLLTLRWGPHVQAWVIDRKGKVSEILWKTLLQIEQNPKCQPIDRERVVSAKLGCRPVLYTPILANHVFRELWQNDLQVHGTKVVDDHMKRLEDEKARKRNDDTKSRMVADGLDFLGRRRADPSPEEQHRVFKEILGKHVSPKKAKKLEKKALLDAHGTPLEGKPEAKIQVVVP